MDEELTCESCESIFKVDFIDGLSTGAVLYCPFCGEEMVVADD